MSFLDKYTEDEVKSFIADSPNFATALTKMGRSGNSGSNTMVLSQYVKDHGISTEHFAANISRAYTQDEIFKDDSVVSQHIMRKHYKNGNYSPYRCAICGQEPFWNGQELTLTLDHINGKNNDHRLTNLRWVCPNCDRQLPTYGTKRHRQTHVCSSCGKTIPRKTKTGLCKECYETQILTNPNSAIHLRKVKHGKYAGTRSNGACVLCGAPIRTSAKYCSNCLSKTRQKATRPDKMTLAKMVSEKSFVAVGKDFGVSDVAIKKWCKDYDIPHTRKELIEWYYNEMGISPKEKDSKPKKTRSEIVRPVHQMDMATKEIIRTYSCPTEALREMGKNPNISHVADVCKGKRKSAYGYFWQYADE